jgi:phytoene synthase
VAGVVGELSAGIFGERSPAVLKFARELGLALQLVNIVRDVGEDARRGRIYLPLDLLRRHGVSPADVLAGRAVPGFAPALGEAAGWARAAFARALAALPPGAWRAQRPGLIMGTIYATLLDEIERGGFHVLEGRTSLTPLRKFTLAWRTWTFGPPPQWPREPARP